MDGFKIADLFLESAFEPHAFIKTLEDAAQILGLSHLFLLRLEPGRPGFVAAPSMQAELDAYAKEGWWQIDDRTNYCGLSARTEDIIRDHLAVPIEVRAKSAIYNEFYQPRGIEWNAGWKVQIDNERWGFSAMRSHGPFDDDEVTILTQFAPAANQAALFVHKLREARSIGTADGIVAAGFQAIILNQAGRVTLSTPGAESLFSEDFKIAAGALYASDAASNLGLKALASYARNPTLPFPEDVIIHRRKAQRPIIAKPLPVRGAGLDILPGARLIIMLNDLNASAKASSDQVRKLFGLTKREAEIATLLAQGESPAKIAEQLQLSLSTTRDYVKSILLKADCHRQSELAHIIGRISSSATMKSDKEDSSAQ